MGNILLVWAIARRLIRKPWTAFFAAALWGVHPVLTESVTNIVGRADLLAAMATLSGFLMYLKSAQSSGRTRLWWLAGLGAVTLAGVFSKESAVVILAVIPLYELACRRERRNGRALALGCLSAAIPVAAMLWARTAVLAASAPARFPFTDNPIVAADFWVGRLTALGNIARYLGLLLWPATLSPDYSYPAIPLASGSAGDWARWTVVAALAAGLAMLYRRSRTAFFFAAFAAVAFAPMSNLFFPIGAIMAERFLYLPAAGLAACAAMAAFAAAGRVQMRRLAPAALCIAIAALGLRTWTRNLDWKDDLTLAASSAVTAEAGKAVALLDDAPDVLSNPAYWREAGAYYMIQSDKAGAAPDGAPTRESAEAARRAAELFSRSTRILKARRHLGEDGPEAQWHGLYCQMSAAYLRTGDAEKALEAADYARALAPTQAETHRHVAASFAKAGRTEEAAVALMEGIIVTGDANLRSSLISLYMGALAPGSCAVTRGPVGPAIDPACPVVHRHICAASAETIRLHLRTGARNAAQEMKKTAIGTYGCPAGPIEAAAR